MTRSAGSAALAEAAATCAGWIVASARTAPPAAAPAPCKKSRRVVEVGVFVGGVLCTLSAWVSPFMVRQPAHLKVLDKWIDQQKEPYTRPEAIRGMIETVLHMLSKDPGEKPAKKAKWSMFTFTCSPLPSRLQG